MRALVLIVALLANSAEQSALQAKLMLFGGDDHKQYLGCLDCNEFSSDSICNEFGAYGNEFSSKGMFNEFAGFGNEYNSSSPWNEYSSSKSVPVLVDEGGKFYGYFTINTSRSDAVSFAPTLLKIFQASEGDVEKVRKALCKLINS